MTNDDDLCTGFSEPVKRVQFSIENNTVEQVEYYDRACREKITPLSGNDPDDFEIILRMYMARKNKKSSGGIKKKTVRPRVPLMRNRVVI